MGETMSEVVVLMGYPASGKSTAAKKGWPNHTRLNRDTIGGSLADVAKELDKQLANPNLPGDFILDNTYAKKEQRAEVIRVCTKYDVPIHCVEMDTSIEDAQVNACVRMIERKGRLLMPEDYKDLKDPNLFPPAVLFAYRKDYQKPTKSEGFASVTIGCFVRRPWTYQKEAIIFDYDGTLRKTKSGEKYPRTPEDVELLPGRVEKLQQLVKEGKKLFGISNMGDIARGKLTYNQAKACYDRTNELLGVDIQYLFCPHNPAPISCWCRKPMPGLAIQLVMQNQLDPQKTLFIGDQTTDKTMAARAGIVYMDQEEYFAVSQPEGSPKKTPRTRKRTSKT